MNHSNSSQKTGLKAKGSSLRSVGAGGQSRSFVSFGGKFGDQPEQGTATNTSGSKSHPLDEFRRVSQYCGQGGN